MERKTAARHFTSPTCPCDMRIDFNAIDAMTGPAMNGGAGTMTVRMYNDEQYRIISTVLHPHSSLGLHLQNSGDDMNYVISGRGKAICAGVEELLFPGVMHICPKGSEHSIINDSDENLVFLTLVAAR